MAPRRPCMSCGAPLDSNGDCATMFCMFNPNTENEMYDAEADHVDASDAEKEGQVTEDLDEAPGGKPYEDEVPYGDSGESDGSQPDNLSDEEMGESETLEDNEISDLADFNDREKLKDHLRDDENEDDLPELDAEDEAELDKIDQDNPPDDLNDERYDENENDEDYDQERGGQGEGQGQGQGGQGEGEGGDEDPEFWICPEDGTQNPIGLDNCAKCGLPKPPQGCSGDCQPSDDFDGEPCPHCTAKKFAEQQENEGKEDQTPEQMEQDWQKFLDDWQKQGQEDNGGENGEKEKDNYDLDLEDQRKSDEEDKQMGEGGDEGDEDLPDRPQGCEGNCPPGDPDDDDAEPCPHCTAKRMRDDLMKDEKGRIGELTKGQTERFDNLVGRIAPKIKQTFGNTAEDFYVGRKADGQFPGEDVSQTIQIESNGVTYWVTIAAARSYNEKIPGQKNDIEGEARDVEEAEPEATD